jgi:histone H3/H4
MTEHEKTDATPSLLVTSKVKQFIKEGQGLNISKSFFEPLNKDIEQTLLEAIEHAKKNDRKTVMGKDFSFYKENPEIKEVLVVASKVKKFIKDKSDLNTSSQVMEQLTLRVQRICLDSIKRAIDDKRKTVMDRDFTPPTTHHMETPSEWGINP